MIAAFLLEQQLLFAPVSSTKLVTGNDGWILQITGSVSEGRVNLI